MASVISVYDTSVFGSPDPSGLTYDPITGQLLLVDSEVDERPFYSPTNMFAISTDGTLQDSYTLTTVTEEPTGVAFNPVTGTLFVTDDDAGMVYEVDRNDPTVVLSSFSAATFGGADLEDILVAPDGTLYILDQANRTIWHTTTDGTLLSATALPSFLKRPEALAYDPREDVFYVAGGWSADIFKVSTDGEILDKIRLLRDYRLDGGGHAQPKALVLVPSDDPNEGSVLWVGDYGKDQVADGRLFAIQLDPPPPPPPGPMVAVLDATPKPQIESDGGQLAFTFTLSEVLAEDVVVTFDTVDGTAQAGTDYTGVSGGTVVIAAGTTQATVFIDLIDDDVIEAEETFSVAIRDATLADSGTVLEIADGEGSATVIDDDPDGPPDVMVYDATVFGSPDPAGLTYIASRGTLMLVDSETDESPFFNSVNMFSLRTDGTVVDRIPFTAVSNEPTGVAHWYDPATGRDLLFITDDDAGLVRIVDMDNPLQEIGSFSTAAFGPVDPEDIDVDPDTGHLFILDESSVSIFEVTQDGVLVSQIALPSNISHPEALAYDSVNQEFYISGFTSSDIYRVSRDGTLIATIAVLENYTRADGTDVIPKGLALVPDADGLGGMTLWVADYGLDQTDDGRLFAIHLDPPPPPALVVSDASPAPQMEGEGAQVVFTFTLSSTMADDVTITVNTVDGTAIAGEDYTGLSGATVTIAAGTTSASLAVDLINDSTVEPQESFTLDIVSAVNASDGTAVDITDGSGMALIVDDDSTGTPSVLVYDSTVFGSPDPSGLTYMSNHGTIILADSEVTEKPFYSNINLFQLSPDGSFMEGIDVTAVTRETTGVAHWYDEANQRDLLFITDDDAGKVLVVDLADPSQELWSFATAPFGANDPEDIAVDPTTGHLFVIGESSATIFEVTQDGTLISTLVLPSAVSRPEAVAYDPVEDVFYVSGYRSPDIYKVSHDGVLIDTIKALRDYDHPDGSNVVPKGLTLVPDDDGGLNLWVADYGYDQVDDGRILVIDLDHGDVWV